jgi:mannose-1-phosphate guanylyltransferase
MTNIILCGGSGTRLWPISRTLMPKQFVKLFGERSLFQLTVERNLPLCDELCIVTNVDQYFLAVDQLEELNTDNSTFDIRHSTFLLEPFGRNTAPAIALACMDLDPDTIVLVTPSDHLIKNNDAYETAVKEAEKMAKEGWLVTFGIEPTYPETGFGYIQAKPGNDESSMLNVECFKEKPPRELAERYLAENSKSNIRNLPLKYYWNSGMFCFKAGTFLDELKKHSPEIYESAQTALENAKIQHSTFRIQESHMEAIPDESIDYAVMEKSDKVKVVPCEIGWSDLGSFDALYEELPKDASGNTENERLIAVDSANNLVLGRGRTIALVDVDDLMVVDTGDALLVSRKGSSQKIRKIVEELKKRGSDLPVVHLTAHRPWGSYTVLEESPGYKIKRIVVKPGKRLSLQKHFHRSEHWIVVSGTATVTVGKRKYLVRPNESTYIKMGEIHRLENEGQIPVVMIEAQVGEYTGEDDIVRFDDDFDREEG